MKTERPGRRSLGAILQNSFHLENRVGAAPSQASHWPFDTCIGTAVHIGWLIRQLVLPAIGLASAGGGNPRPWGAADTTLISADATTERFGL